jgi:hypothetical protein
MTTARQIIKRAMQRAGVLVKNEDPAADEASDGLARLNDILSMWSNDGMLVYARTLENFNLVGGTTSYTIGTGQTFNTARPMQIISAYVRSGTTDYPLEIISDEKYAAIANKASQGIPEYLNYDNGYPAGTIKLYGTPSSAYVIYLLTEKALTAFSTLDTAASLPPGWEKALTDNLAVELEPEYGQPPNPALAIIARKSKGAIKAAILRAHSYDYPVKTSGFGNIYTGWH